jgi:hypothetical protein
MLKAVEGKHCCPFVPSAGQAKGHGRTIDRDVAQPSKLPAEADKSQAPQVILCQA